MSDTTTASDAEEDVLCKSDLGMQYEDAVRLNPELDFHWVINYDENDAPSELDAALVFRGDGWVAWALAASDGAGAMVGADAIIGVPGEDVAAYTLLEQDENVTKALVRRNSVGEGSLTRGTIDQRVEDGETITMLMFARELQAPAGFGLNMSVTNVSQLMLHASGGTNLSYHGESNRGVLNLPLLDRQCRNVTSGGQDPNEPINPELPLQSPDPNYEWTVGVGLLGQFMWRVDEDTGTFYGRFEVSVSPDPGWLGFGVARANGDSSFSDTIIGVASQNSILNYQLWGLDMAQVFPSPTQWVGNNSIIESIGTKTSMIFSRPLQKADVANSRDIEGETTFIFSAGPIDEDGALEPHEVGVYHQVTVDVNGPPVFTEEPTTEPYVPPTPAPVDETQVLSQQCRESEEEGFEFFEQLDSDGDVFFHWTAYYNETNLPRGVDYIHAKLVVKNEDGLGWIAWGVNDEAAMIGGDAVVGSLDDGRVSFYNLNSYTVLGGGVTRRSFVETELQEHLWSTSVSSGERETSLEFARELTDSTGEGVNMQRGENFFLWAYGNGDLSYHGSNRNLIVVNLHTCAKEVALEQSSLAYSHGWIMAVAYAMVMPLGMMMSRYGKARSSCWLVVHICLQVLGVLLAAGGLGVAVRFVDAVLAGRHFDSDHGRQGILVVILSFIQLWLGSSRPPAPSGRWENKSKRRWIWEYCHKALALVILVFGVVQIFNGIKQLEEFSSSARPSAWSNAFLAYILACCAAALILECNSLRRNGVKLHREPRTDELYPQMSGVPQGG